MRLSWNEIRARAAAFAAEWSGRGYERGESQTFYNDFFDVFGVSRRRVASFEAPVRMLGDRRGFIDLFWKGVLLVEQKSVGRSLARAREQAFDYFPGLSEADLPRFVLLSDFQTFELHDLEDGGQAYRFGLADLHRNVERFGFILGVERRTFHDQDPVNIRASELMGRLHDALEASGYSGHDLERLLVRLLFCLFADDTGIFDVRGTFQALVEERTAPDGSDLGPWLTHVFQVLDTPAERRQTNLDEDLARLPYVNGDLFRDRLATPSCDAGMRSLLLGACAFSWDAISPAIFGALFQSVMSAGERRSQGAHYTTERNILKAIGPLFLDGLRAELDRLNARRDNGRRRAFEAFQSKLASLRFLDPACGCGNFLIIAYRELRRLETEALKGVYADVLSRLKGGVAELNVAGFSKVDVDQFYGIELDEFAARIAEVALWMTDHIENNRLSLEFGQNYARIPLRKAPNIRRGDALATDWAGVLDPGDCSYVLGNPPFVGAKYQTAAQRAQVRSIARLGSSGGTLDYVAAWFIKAGDYLRGRDAAIALVATNSITQGEQVGQLWPILFMRCGLEITFAHRTFAWGSDARGMAHVHVVIIGLAPRANEPAVKRLFSYAAANGDPTESRHAALSPYLTDAGALTDRHTVVHEASRPLCAVPAMVIGTKPIDGGNLILSDDEKDALVRAEPSAAAYLRPFIGGSEYIRGQRRWLLLLEHAPPAEVRSMPAVRARLKAVREFREASTSPPTRAMAATPARFHVTVVPERPFLVVPESSSERRDYVPIGWLEPPAVPSSLVRVILDAEPWHFGVLTSRMHMAWLSHVGGRLKSDYRYSIGLVFNPFPWPSATPAQKAGVSALAQAVLAARGAHRGATLADLYDRDAMPTQLRRAHAALDAAVDRIYRGAAFGTDWERMEFLFALYERLSAPMTTGVARRPIGGHGPRSRVP